MSPKIGEETDGTPVYHDFETKAALKAFNDACLAGKTSAWKQDAPRRVYRLDSCRGTAACN